MSITIDFFFNSRKNLEALAAEMNSYLGSALKPYEGDPENFYAFFMGMEFSLSSAEGYVNDGDADFENFAYEIGFRTAAGNFRMRIVQLEVLAMVIYVLHRRMHLTGMLVYDTQIVIARYEERLDENFGPYLFDVIS